MIGYKKFFTPNGDGIHDNWRILGIREDFQPNSRVYIFDRYGKLLKELDPVTEGWDVLFAEKNIATLTNGYAHAAILVRPEKSIP